VIRGFRVCLIVTALLIFNRGDTGESSLLLLLSFDLLLFICKSSFFHLRGCASSAFRDTGIASGVSIDILGTGVKPWCVGLVSFRLRGWHLHRGCEGRWWLKEERGRATPQAVEEMAGGPVVSCVSWLLVPCGTLAIFRPYHFCVRRLGYAHIFSVRHPFCRARMDTVWREGCGCHNPFSSLPNDQLERTEGIQAAQLALSGQGLRPILQEQVWRHAAPKLDARPVSHALP
jgi:hypothetical protein